MTGGRTFRLGPLGADVELIKYDGEIMATVGAQRAYLAGRAREVDDTDPLVLFVSLMAAYALQLRDEPELGPYSDEWAERFARCILIDDAEFSMLDANGFDDPLLAGHFDVPVEQVAKKRDDIERFGSSS
jgi:hypothetical protein